MYEYQARILKIVDGDTLDVEIDLGLETFRRIRLRLWGIDTPEVYGVSHNSEEYAKGQEASSYVKGLLPVGSRVIVRTIKDKTGKYGRYLARVLVPKNQDDVSGEKFDLRDRLVSLGLGKAL